MKTIAVFTFPSDGWHTPPNGVSANVAAKAASMRLSKLRRKNKDTPVSLIGLAGGETVVGVSLTLGDLLEALLKNPRKERCEALDVTFEHSPLPDVKEGLPCPDDAYVAYCNGRRCEHVQAAWRGYQRPQNQGSSVAPPNENTSKARREEPLRPSAIPPVVRPESSKARREEPLRPSAIPPVVRPESPVYSGSYEVRVLVHTVEDITGKGSKEFFPDIYVMARMRSPQTEWRLTDVHRNSVKSRALFQYRLILPTFTYPASPRRTGMLGRLEVPPPILEVKMMDEDMHTSDDKLGTIKLNLEDLVLPSDKESCGMNTLSNKRVNLFDAQAVKPFRHPNAVVPRELTGFWPILRRSKRSCCKQKHEASVGLTIQLLTA